MTASNCKLLLARQRLCWKSATTSSTTTQRTQTNPKKTTQRSNHSEKVFIQRSNNNQN